MEIINHLKEYLNVGLVTAEDVQWTYTQDELKDSIAEAVSFIKSQDPQEMILRHNYIRDLLRKGGFKPRGRAKPASEYLYQAACEGRFPIISNLVDINNYLSLESGFPISLLDKKKIGNKLEIRLGKTGEKYIFNSSGQVIDLESLINVCCLLDGTSIPIGNPVKDSMQAKMNETTTSVIGFVYGPKTEEGEKKLKGLLEKFEMLLKQYASAQYCDSRII